MADIGEIENYFPMQILMNVQPTLVLVVKFVITLMDHLIVSALTDTCCLRMEEHVEILTSVRQDSMNANKSV